MNEEEKRLLKEVTAIRARELDLVEKRTQAMVATARAILVVGACGFLLWWGVGALRTMEADLARAVFAGAATAAVSFALAIVAYASVDDDSLIGSVIGFGAMIISIFVAALSWSRF